jgi:outer membrane protein assembly factor BamB
VGIQVGLTRGATVGAVGVAVLLSAVFVPAQVAGNPSAAIQILFDFGDGSYVWGTETIADPSATNATWAAVQHAATANGIAIETSWSSEFGVGIMDIGDRNPPAKFVGLFEWNASGEAWEFTHAGVSHLVLRDGDAIALYAAAFAVPSYLGRFPVPTPAHPRPSTAFRGDLSNAGVAGSAAPDRVRLLWDRDTGSREVGSTPAVADGRLFVSTLKGMVALDAGTGELKWTSPRGKGLSSPTVYDDSVFVGTSNGTVLRLNAANGSILWETRLLAKTNFTGISSSPKVSYDSVYVGTFNESGGPGEVVALWEGNGTVRWRHATGSVHFSSPAYRDGVVYVGVMGRYNLTTQVSFDPPYGVLALNGASGGAQWFASTGGSVAASPAILGNSIIAPAKDGKVYALNRTTGVLLWTSAVDAGVSSAAVFGGTAYVGGGAFGSGGRVVALDAATGAVKWSSSAPNGPVQASLTYSGGKILFATNAEHATIYALDATNGALVWSYEPAGSEYILASPVVADGVVYAPNDNGHVVALAEEPARPSSISLAVLEVGGIAFVAAAVAIVAWVLVRRRRRSGP